jgi:hypothetical protein
VLEAVREAVGAEMSERLDQIWYVEAGSYVFFDLTKPIITGSDVIG